MAANVIVVTVDGNIYKIEKNGISDFALIGVLECILVDLKSVNRQGESSQIAKEVSTEEFEKPVDENPVSSEMSELSGPKTETELKTSEVPDIESTTATATEIPTPDIKNRILNARATIRGLKGEVEESDLSIMTDDELQEEFEALTAQYKRLKNSQVMKKK